MSKARFVQIEFEKEDKRLDSKLNLHNFSHKFDMPWPRQRSGNRRIGLRAMLFNLVFSLSTDPGLRYHRTQHLLQYLAWFHKQLIFLERGSILPLLYV